MHDQKVVTLQALKELALREANTSGRPYQYLLRKDLHTDNYYLDRVGLSRYSSYEIRFSPPEVGHKLASIWKTTRDTYGADRFVGKRSLAGVWSLLTGESLTTEVQQLRNQHLAGEIASRQRFARGSIVGEILNFRTSLYRHAEHANLSEHVINTVLASLDELDKAAKETN